MKKFKIFEYPGGAREAVKVGWSWPAFFFNMIWLFVKGLYYIGIGYIFGFLVFAFLLGFLGVSKQDIDRIFGLTNLFVMMIFGVFVNKWRESNLQKRGYKIKDTVSAVSPEDAISHYLKH